VLEGVICECLWLGGNDVELSMVKRAYQNFNMESEKGFLHNSLIDGRKILSFPHCQAH
jgi:hypothetical protein